MLTTKEAIQRRRSIRKFKPEPVPDEYILELLEAARLAPSPAVEVQGRQGSGY